LECAWLYTAGPGTTSQGSAVRNVHIHHNHLFVTAAAGSFCNAISSEDSNGGSAQSTDATQFAGLAIDHNRITSSDQGISVQASQSHIDANIINAYTSAIVCK